MKVKKRDVALSVGIVLMLFAVTIMLQISPQKPLSSERTDSAETMSKPIIVKPEDVRAVLNEPAKEFYN